MRDAISRYAAYMFLTDGSEDWLMIQRLVRAEFDVEEFYMCLRWLICITHGQITAARYQDPVLACNIVVTAEKSGVILQVSRVMLVSRERRAHPKGRRVPLARRRCAVWGVQS